MSSSAQNLPGTPAPPAPAVWRYERKFLVEDLSAAQVSSFVRLHPALFTTLYPPRWINNVYLDDRDFGSLLDNLSGADARTKLRIRWYGELFGPVARPVLEKKIKLGLMGTKESCPLAPFVLDAAFGRQTLEDVLRRSPGAGNDLRRALRARLPVLINRYHRRYYRSASGHLRLTLDTRLEFRDVRSLGNTFLRGAIDRRGVVLELKYGQEHDDEAREVAARFPVRLTKSSKYVSGLGATRG